MLGMKVLLMLLHTQCVEILSCGFPADEVSENPADSAATPSQAQAMMKSRVREREKENVELLELEQ